jgi:hypothetical protein
MTPDERDDRQNFSTTTSAKTPGGGSGTDYGVGAGTRYDDNVRQFVAGGRVDPAAQDAKRSIEGPDGPALHEAEVTSARHGAMPGDPPWMAKVREVAHVAIDRLLTSVVHAEEWLKAQSARQAERERNRH